MLGERGSAVCDLRRSREHRREHVCRLMKHPIRTSWTPFSSGDGQRVCQQSLSGRGGVLGLQGGTVSHARRKNGDKRDIDFSVGHPQHHHTDTTGCPDPGLTHPHSVCSNTLTNLHPARAPAVSLSNPMISPMLFRVACGHPSHPWIL